MQDFEGYFTLDGSVGLYSESDSDIYHSVYGALSEAYDKFIAPANLEKYFKNNNKVEVLDVCYGIGYNTKSFLNYFFKNFSQKNFKKRKTLTTDIDAIDTNNIERDKNYSFCEKNNPNQKECNDEIYSNNISEKKNSKFNKFYVNERPNMHASKSDDKNSYNKNYSIFIRAIDINSTLMKLSPFVKTSCRLPKFSTYKTGIEKVDSLLSKTKKIKIEKTHKLLKEVNMILIIKLIDQFKEDIFSEDVVRILSSHETSKFFDKNLVNFAKFYLNKRYNLSSNGNKSTFLHNIYYQYISKSYKNTLKVLEDNGINIEFECTDARKACNDNYERYDYIFLDAFSPTKTPSLWSDEFLKLLYNHIKYNGLLLTYSKSASIRHAMLNSNFEVGKIYNREEKKFIGTIASKNQNKIIYKLNKYELGLINTLAGVTYKDKNLTLTNAEIIKNRKLELENSTLQSSTNFIKNFKGDKYEL